ncbi:DUF2914 domain-containing protein [Candidatus Parcubacteria bacterium]|nr:MAG: DUF2914 domain-containing protein [Candidatus Parcubacteria bacterium]
MIRQYLPRSTEELIRWYERHVAPFSLLAGFIVDNILFRNIDLLSTTITLALYLAVAVGGSFVLNLVESGRVRHRVVLQFSPFLPVVVQFAFGGMFSGFFVLYSESATIAVSWVSVVVLAFLLVGNERFRKRYQRFSFQVGVLFVVLLGYLFFLVPFALKRIGPEMFFVSSALSVVLITGYVFGTRKVMPELVRTHMPNIAQSIGLIFLIFSLLYVTNAIPPLPLALKDGGVYHRIQRIGTDYIALHEPELWYEEYLPFGQTFHRAPGENLHAFSAVFAPSGISTKLTHEWQHYNPDTEEWDTIARVQFPVAGGRDGGYRGYSTTASRLTGKWRVNVLTSYGQVVGRISFTVVDVPGPVELEEKTL